MLIRAGELSARRFFESCFDNKKRVLIEEYVDHTGFYTGYTDNYIKVYINHNYVNNTSDSCIVNEFKDVRLSGILGDGMAAEA